MSTLNRDVMALLQDVEAQARRYGAAALRPPCDEQRLGTLRLRVRDELGLALPAELGELLRVADGMNWNGLYLYPSADLVAANLDHRDVEGLQDVLVFGNDSLDLLTWHSATGEFQLRDLVPRQVVETFPTFDALLRLALNRCLNS